MQATESKVFMPVIFTPQILNFGAVAPGSSGPDISIDPSFHAAISFAGGVKINAPSDANVTAEITGDTSHFKVRDITALEWVLEPVDASELPPGHHGRIPKVKVLEPVAQSDGSAALPVKKDQIVLARVEYLAPSAEGTFAAKLVVSADGWDPVEVPLSFFVSQVSTVFTSNPVFLAQGTVMPARIVTQVILGPDTEVNYQISRTQLHSGVTLVEQTSFPATKAPQTHFLQFATDIDAPLGPSAIAIDQFAQRRTGLLVPVLIQADPEPDIARAAIAAKAAARADFLGKPTSGVVAVTRSDGTPVPECFVQHFERGEIYFSPTSGAHEVYGDIKTKYDLMGGPVGILGFPQTDVLFSLDHRGRFSDFHGASIYWHPDIGPRVVSDPIRQSWRSQGAELGPLGYPVRDHHPMHNATHIDLPDPNGLSFGVFDKGAIVNSSEGLFNALVVPDKELEPEILDGLKGFVRRQFEKEFAKSPDNIGLHPGIDVISILPWEFDIAQGTGRAIVFRIHGFHDNGIAPDTDFDIDLGLRIGWKLDPNIDLDTRPLTATLVPGYPVVDVSGLGADSIRAKVKEKILAVFSQPFKLPEVPLIVDEDGTRIWVIIDLAIGMDGVLRVYVNPEQKNIVAGGGPLGPSLRDQVERELIDNLNSA